MHTIPLNTLNDAELDMHFKNYLSGLEYYGNQKQILNRSQNKDDGGIVHGKPGIDTNDAKVRPGSFIVPKKKVAEAKAAGIISTKPANKMQSGGTPIKISAGEAIITPEKAESLFAMGVDLNKFAPDSEHKYSSNKFYEGSTVGSLKRVPKGTAGSWIGEGGNSYIHVSPTEQSTNTLASQDNINAVNPTTTTDTGSLLGNDIYYPGISSTQDLGTEFDTMKTASQPNDDYWTDEKTDALYNQGNPPLSQDQQDLQGLKDKSNLLYGAEAAATVGSGLYNLMQKYQPGPKPGVYTPQLYHPNTAGMKANAEADITRQSATERYNRRNVGITTSPDIYANELNARLKTGANIIGVEESAKERNINTLNQANLYNMGNTNQYNAREAAGRSQFRQMKGQAISQNISELGNIGGRALSTNIALTYGPKATKFATNKQDATKWAISNPDHNERMRLSKLSNDELIAEYLKTK